MQPCSRGRFSLGVVVGLVLLGALPSPGAQRTLTLEEAVRLALEGNPELRMAQAEIEAAEARVSGAALLLQANPELEAAIGPRQRSEGRSLDYRVSLHQPVEAGGQRGLRREEAEALRRAAVARLAVRRGVLMAEVREAFGRVLATEAQVKLATDMVELARQAQEAAEEKFRAGDVSLIEVNTARVEAGRAHRERLSAAQRRELALGQLKLLLAVEAGEGLTLQGTLEPTQASPPLNGGEWLARARENRADMAAARAELHAAQAAQQLAAREAIPTPRVGVGYSREEDAHILQATLGLPLPVFNRNQAERGASRARVLQAEVSLEALERRVAQEVRLAAARYKAARDALDVFAGGALQAARENVDLATEGYRAGKLDIFQLLLIRRETLEARRGHIEALEELNASEAGLERALGGSPLLTSGQGGGP